MRDPNRITKIIGLLHKYWGANPDLRLGQIIVNLTPDKFKRWYLDDGYDPEDPDGDGCDISRSYRTRLADPFHIEDDRWEEILRNAIKEPA